ncbi:septal ring lytic transglycosylase RlpA family protein [Euzebya tangerina]|uniref:septal ring lytic transglycosylase RlpA family protein n=1 Tax=Euzebya tangerina TaxID=591198 RepID=UPI0013C2C6F6|nr:septal ring lytic transglycosylase RlpA family protein [Euzebya tangerina]
MIDPDARRPDLQHIADRIESGARRIGLVPDGTRLTERGVIVYAVLLVLTALLVLWLLIRVLVGGDADAPESSATESGTATTDQSTAQGSEAAGQREVVEAFDATATVYGPGITSTTTASGDTFDPQGPTAAHPTLEFGTDVRVTNLATGLQTVVTINDRLPDAGFDRIDLTVGAGQVIGITVDSGPTLVTLEVLAPG